MVEVAEAVGEAAGLLDEQVDGFGAAVGHPAGVEVGQHLGPPGTQGAACPDRRVFQAQPLITLASQRRVARGDRRRTTAMCRFSGRANIFGYSCR